MGVRPVKRVGGLVSRSSSNGVTARLARGREQVHRLFCSVEQRCSGPVSSRGESQAGGLVTALEAANAAEDIVGPMLIEVIILCQLDRLVSCH